MRITVYYKDIDGKIGCIKHKVDGDNHDKACKQIVEGGIAYKEFDSTILIPPSALLKVIIS